MALMADSPRFGGMNTWGGATNQLGSGGRGNPGVVGAGFRRDPRTGALSFDGGTQTMMTDKGAVMVKNLPNVDRFARATAAVSGTQAQNLYSDANQTVENALPENATFTDRLKELGAMASRFNPTPSIDDPKSDMAAKLTGNFVAGTPGMLGVSYALNKDRDVVAELNNMGYNGQAIADAATAQTHADKTDAFQAGSQGQGLGGPQSNGQVIIQTDKGYVTVPTPQVDIASGIGLPSGTGTGTGTVATGPGTTGPRTTGTGNLLQDLIEKNRRRRLTGF
jgi:hypothetical protein